MVARRQVANGHLEEGIVAELTHAVDPKKPLNVGAFKVALRDLQSLKSSMKVYDDSLAALEKIDARCHKAPIGAQTIARLVAAENPPLPRLADRGGRYGDAGGVASTPPSALASVTDILAAFRADLKILSEALDDVIAGLRDALPLAEKGEFAKVMLSGRNAFGDKMPKFTQMFATYHYFYVRSVGVTVTATMELYPKGYEWLQHGSSPAK